MRIFFLKFLGLALWSAFLFVPFIARADSGFDIFLPGQVFSGEEAAPGRHDLFAINGFDGLYMPVDQGWNVRLNAGRDTVLTGDFSEEISQDRIPLDDGHRESFFVGVRLNYSLN